MKKKRDMIFKVSVTRTYRSEDPSPGKETWDKEESVSVVASDVEDAIARVRKHLDSDDKSDGFIKRRVSLTIDSVSEGSTIDLI